MRILHIISSLGFGGAEMHLLSLCRHQRMEGYSPEVAYLLGEGALRGRFEEQGIAVTHCPIQPLGKLPVGLTRLARLLSKLNPRLVHTHLLKADALGAVMASLVSPGIPIVSFKHNDESALLSLPIGLVHGGISAVFTDETLAISDHVADYVSTRGFLRTRPRVVHYGVSREKFSPVTGQVRDALRFTHGFSGRTVVLNVARIAPQKDHITLIRAFSRAHRQAPHLLLVIVGKQHPSTQGALDEVVASSGLHGHVRFLGVREDIPQLMQAADLFVLSSRWEGLGLVLLEAMASGLPVVSTSVSAVPEVLGAEWPGPLTAPGDDSALAEAILAVAASEELREGIKAYSRQRLEAFSETQCFDRLAAVYRRHTN